MRLSDAGVCVRPFPYLLTPSTLSMLNRARRREKGDLLRGLVFGGIGAVVTGMLFAVVFWLTWQLSGYEELGAYLVRLGLSWLFLTFLSFVAFSALVASLSTFFLSEDLRLLLAAPIPADRLFYARFLRTAAQASWMVIAFLLPVLLAVGMARCATPLYYLVALLSVVPFVVIPTAAGALITLLLVNVFPARRAREILMFVGLLFAVGLVILIRLLRPERLLSVQSLPDVTAFFASLQTPLTPLLPSFWAGEALFEALQGRVDWLHLGALWTTAAAVTVLARASFGWAYFSGWSKAQEARKARFTRLAGLTRLVRALPIEGASRTLLLKDLRIFLRDPTQWSQLLLILALAVVYVYNFQVLDLDKIPYLGPLVRNVYAFVNLGLAAFVLSAVAVRFVFPAVSAEGAAFWIVRTAPVSLSRFLWSKFWTGLWPTLLLCEALTLASNAFLRTDRLLEVIAAVAIFVMSFALVGLAAGLGAQYPRFNAENVTQVAGSYGGIVFMVAAVLYIMAMLGLLGWPCLSYLWHEYRGLPISPARQALMALCFLLAFALSAITFSLPMRRGIRALERLGE